MSIVTCLLGGAVSVNLAVDEKRTFLICAAVLDKGDGAHFGRFIATETLSRFIRDTIPKQSSIVASSLDVVRFGAAQQSEFETRLPDIVRSTVRPILNELATERFVRWCALTSVSEKQLVYSTSKTLDPLGVVANLHAIANLSEDMFASYGEVPNGFVLENARFSIQVTYSRYYALVVCLRKAAEASKAMESVRKTFDTLTRVFVLLGSLHDSPSFLG
jgi:hypothetical protein